MSNDRFDNLVRQGVVYRVLDYQAAVAANSQSYIVFQASANKNLIIEKFDFSSSEGEFKFGGFVNEPFTGGSAGAIDINADATVVGSLEGVVISSPVVTAAPLDMVNTDIGFIAVNNEANTEFPFIIPKGQHIVIMIDNENRSSVSADILTKFWLREEGR